MSIYQNLANVNQSSNCVTQNSKMHRCDNYSAYSVCAIPKLIFITCPSWAITLFSYYFRKFVKSLNLSLRTRRAQRVTNVSQGLPFIHSSFFKHGPPLGWAKCGGSGGWVGGGGGLVGQPPTTTHHENFLKKAKWWEVVGFSKTV